MGFLTSAWQWVVTHWAKSGALVLVAAILLWGERILKFLKALWEAKEARAKAAKAEKELRSIKENTELRQSVSPSPQPAVQSNLVLKDVYFGTLHLVGDIWSKNVPQGLTRPVPKYEAIFAEIKNAAKQGEVVGGAYKIRAELVIEAEEFTPLPWLDEHFNTVNFAFGDVKYVVLAVGVPTQFPALGDWRVVLNRRDFDFAPGVPSMEFDRFLKRVVPESKVKLNLLHVASGQILRSFKGLCKWKEGYGNPQISFSKPEERFL